MSFVTTSNRHDAYHALVNTLLKDGRRYCNNCDATYTGNICCEDPQIGDNASVARTIAMQCAELRERAKDEHASFNNKSIRLGIQLPVFIYAALEQYEKGHGRKLIQDNKDIMFLMRCFPQFRIPRSL